MEIKGVIIKEHKVEIRVFSYDKNSIKPGQILRLEFNSTTWNFKVKEVTIGAIDMKHPHSLILAETYGYYGKINRDIDAVDDFSKMLGLEPTILTDVEKLKKLHEWALYN